MAIPRTEPRRPLTAADQAGLERRAQASSARVDQVRRARALPAGTRGHPFAQAAGQAGFKSATTVTDLVNRFNRRGVAAVSIAPGRGRPPTYDRTARAHSIATRQRPPDRRHDGTATWSLSTRERRLRRDAFPTLGATTIRRVLEEAGRSYQRPRTWCPTGTAHRQRKRGVVTVVDPQTEEQRG